MPDYAIDSAWEQMASIRRGRTRLVEQIRKSQETIAGSQELLSQMDEILAKSDLKP